MSSLFSSWFDSHGHCIWVRDTWVSNVWASLYITGMLLKLILKLLELIIVIGKLTFKILINVTTFDHSYSTCLGSWATHQMPECHQWVTRIKSCFTAVTPCLTAHWHRKFHQNLIIHFWVILHIDEETDLFLSIMTWWWWTTLSVVLVT